MVKKLSFAHLVGAVLVLSFILGFAVFVLSSYHEQRNDRRHRSRESHDHDSGKDALSAVRHLRVDRDAAARGTAHVQAGLQLGRLCPREGCGTIIVGSPAYQSPAG